MPPTRGNVPWFGVFEGKRGLLDLFAAFTTVEFNDVTDKALVAEGDTVMTWVHVAFTTAGRAPRRDRRGPGLEAGRRQGRVGRRPVRHRRRGRRLRVSAGAARRPRPRLPHPAGRGRAGRPHPGRRLLRRATIHTSLYDPAATFPGFADHDVRTLPLDRVAAPPPPPPPGAAAAGPGLLAPARRRRGHHLLVERLGARGPRDRGQGRLLPQSGPVALPADQYLAGSSRAGRRRHWPSWLRRSGGGTGGRGHAPTATW